MDDAKSTIKRVEATRKTIKGARAALDFTQADLAKHAGMARETVANFERGEHFSDETRDKLQLALEAHGVVFTNGKEPGFRLTR